MKYYILEGIRNPGSPVGEELEKTLEAHLKFMVPYFEAGKILTSGPLTNGQGGIILLRLEDEEQIEDFIAADPFYQSGIQEYRFLQFDIYQMQEYAREWTK